MSNDWKKVESAGDSWKYENVGDEVSGVYVRMQENVGPNNSPMYHLEQEDGEIIGVWGNSVLNDKFASVPYGEEVRIVYQGKKDSQKGGRQYNVFDFYRREPEGGNQHQSTPDSDNQDTEDIPF